VFEILSLDSKRQRAETEKLEGRGSLPLCHWVILPADVGTSSEDILSLDEMRVNINIFGSLVEHWAKDQMNNGVTISKQVSKWFTSNTTQ